MAHTREQENITHTSFRQGWDYSHNDSELTDHDIMAMLDGCGNMLPPDLRQAALDAIRTSLTGNASRDAVIAKILELNQIASDIARAPTVESARAVAERAPPYFRNIGMDMAENKDSARLNQQMGMGGMLALVSAGSLHAIGQLPGFEHEAACAAGHDLCKAGVKENNLGAIWDLAMVEERGPDRAGLGTKTRGGLSLA